MNNMNDNSSKIEKVESISLESDTHGNKVLITGGCGFIGINLAKTLSAKGYRVKVLDDLSTGDKQTLFSAIKGLQPQDVVIGDIRDNDLVKKMVQNTDVVIHLAAYTSVVESIEKPDLCWDINVAGSLNLLEACRISGGKQFIFASSNAVLGKQPPPADEKQVPTPLSPYGASKLAVEALCTAYYNSYGLNTICLRFANCYGPYSQEKRAVIPIFIRQMKNRNPVFIYGDGNQTRDFVHVDDICQAIRLCISNNGSAAGEIFQIASGIETSINELLSMFQDIYGYTINVIHEPARKGEIIRNYSSIEKARQMLNFKPVIGLKEGLRRLIIEQ
jgi:UDP-glucose 4-epimerase